jgi:hypothetical protein
MSPVDFPMPPAPRGETISYGPSLVPEARVIGGQNYNLREQRTVPALLIAALSSSGVRICRRYRE